MGTERVLMAAALAGLALALAASEAARYFDRRDIEALRESVGAAQADAQAALAAIIAPETLQKATASVYLIVVDGAPRGTAFVIDREKGVLATAAHTAESLPFGKDGARISIINRATRTPISVRSAHLHAGFGAFREIIETYQPVRRGTPLSAPQVAPIRDLAFDAGLIHVDPLDPETGENRLGPALPIAPEEKLRRLSAGTAIAVVGYPYDTLDDGFAPDAATSRIERGVVAAMIAPLDSASNEENTEVANLIIHRLATAGGNSGSPIINAEGEVVGIHTHGIESASSNADSAAQRADVIFDLLAPERELARLNGVFVPAWTRTLAHWARAEDVLPWSFYREYQPPEEGPAILVGGVDFAAEPPFVKELRSLSFDAATPARRVEAADIDPSVGAAASEGVEGDPAGFTIKESGEYFGEWVSVDRSRHAVLFAFDYSMRTRAGFCRLTTYWRKRGDARLQVQRNRPSFELHLPPAGVFSEDYQLVYRRDGACDPQSRKFFAGAISWSPPASGEERIAVAGTPAAGEAATGPVSQLIHATRTSIARLLACGGPSANEAPECDPPEYLEIDGAPDGE